LISFKDSGAEARAIAAPASRIWRPTRDRPPWPHIRARRSGKPTRPIMAGGAPARLLDMYRPPGGDFPAELAVTIHAGTAFVIASQDPTRTPAAESADRAAVHTFLAGVRIQR